MKILFLSLDPRTMIDLPSGGSVHIRSLVEAFEALGHDVLALVPESGQGGSMVGKFKGRGKLIKSIIPGPIWLTIRDIYDVWRDRKKFSELMAVIEEFKPDFVFERNAYLQTAGARASLSSSTPYFLEIVAPTVEERAKSFGAPLGRYHDKKEIERALASNGLIVLSNVVCRILVGRGVPAEKIKVFPIGVNPDRFADCKQKGRRLREKLGIEGPAVGFVGSIAAYHGVERLIDAAVEVKEKYPGVVVWIVGGGRTLGDLRARAREMGIEENVRFEGRVPPEEVPAYMAAFDVAVLPSTAYYGSPIKLCEYGAAGVPVIAPRIESIEEMFGDPEVAALIGQDDSLADAIIGLLTDEDRAKKLAENIRELVLSRYTWLEIARGIIKFVEERLP